MSRGEAFAAVFIVVLLDVATCPECQTPRGSASGFETHVRKCNSSLPPIPMEYMRMGCVVP